ncbi:unnamed protein product [Lota lota]
MKHHAGPLHQSPEDVLSAMHYRLRSPSRPVSSRTFSPDDTNASFTKSQETTHLNRCSPPPPCLVDYKGPPLLYSSDLQDLLFNPVTHTTLFPETCDDSKASEGRWLVGRKARSCQLETKEVKQQGKPYETTPDIMGRDRQKPGNHVDKSQVGIIALILEPL